MIGMWGFLKQHVIAAIVMVVSATITVVSLARDIWEAATFGFPNEVWQAGGAGLFFLSVITILYKQHQRLEGVGVDRACTETIEPKIVGFKSLDFTHWDAVDRLTLLQAACLWAEDMPVTHPLMLEALPNARARYAMLKQAIQSGSLAAYSASGSSGQYVSRRNPEFGDHLRRRDLLDYAESIGDRPKFLFVEER